MLRQQPNKRLFAECGILTLLIFVQCFWDGAMWLVYPVLLALVIVENYANALSLIIWLLPFAWLGKSTSLLLWVICIVVVVGKFYGDLLFRQKRYPRSSLWLWLGLFVVYCLLPWGPYNVNLFSRLGLFLACLAVLGVLIVQPQLIRLRFNLRLVVLAVAVASVMSLLIPVVPNLHFLALITEWSGGRFHALFMHPNNLGMFCEIVAALLAYLLISRQAELADYLALLTVTILGFLSMSKAFLLLIMLVYLMILVWLIRRNWRLSLTIVVLLTAVIVSICALCTEVVSEYLGRFTSGIVQGANFTDVMNSLTTHRYDLWVTYSGYLLQNPLVLLFGRGLGTAALYDPLSGQTLSAHNFFLSALYEMGLVGTALLAVTLVLLLRQLRRTKTTKIHPAIIVLVVIFVLLLCEEDLILMIA